MLYDLLWDLWRSFLALVAAAVGVVALVALIILVGSDPTRSDAWVWGLAAASVVGALVGTSSTPRHPKSLRLTAVLWLVQLVGSVALIVLAAETQGLMVLGYALAAGAVVQWPDAIGLWPGPISDRSHSGAGR